MYNSEDDYLEATRHAQVNTYVEKKEKSLRLIFINLVLSILLATLLFFYFQKDINSFGTNKLAVLGVSYRSTESEYSDDELKSILNKEADENLGNNNANLTNQMNQLISEPMVAKKSSYTEAISRELEDKHTKKSRIVLVKKGDTLSSLAEKYYGDSQAFDKIIQYNKHISKQSHKLYVGEKINIPY